MKIRLTVSNESGSATWIEDYFKPRITTQEQATSFGIGLVSDFNASLRPFETPRKFISAEITEDPYDIWFEELKKIAVEKFNFSKKSADSFYQGDWKEYFSEGLSPEQAMIEDMEAGI